MVLSLGFPRPWNGRPVLTAPTSPLQALASLLWRDSKWEPRECSGWRSFSRSPVYQTLPPTQRKLSLHPAGCLLRCTEIDAVLLVYFAFAACAFERL